jgi:hypothetical protein
VIVPIHNGANVKYKLVALSLRLGDTPRSGHWYGVLKSPNQDDWVFLDDAKRSPLVGKLSDNVAICEKATIAFFVRQPVQTKAVTVGGGGYDEEVCLGCVSHVCVCSHKYTRPLSAVTGGCRCIISWYVGGRESTCVDGQEGDGVGAGVEGPERDGVRTRWGTERERVGAGGFVWCINTSGVFVLLLAGVTERGGVVVVCD